MGVYISQNEKGELSIQPDSYKKDFKLTQWVTNTLNAQLKYEAARAEGRPGNMEKAVATLTRPDGTVRPVSKSQAVQELSKAAQVWEDRSRQIGIDPDLKIWLKDRARMAQDEILRLEGKPVPEREPVAKARVTVTLPR